jgi:hypothetical protein
MVLNLPLDECIDNTHNYSNLGEKQKKKTNKKKLQQANESQTKSNRKNTWKRQVSEPLGKGTARHIRD